MLTLRDIINLRKRYEKAGPGGRVYHSQFWRGYNQGWAAAYQDLQEILEHAGFNLDIIVKKDETKN